MRIGFLLVSAMLALSACGGGSSTTLAPDGKPLPKAYRIGSNDYETELETLGAWMEDPSTRNVVLDRTATQMGFAYFQEANGKIWWTMVTGAPSSASPIHNNTCNFWSVVALEFAAAGGKHQSGCRRKKKSTPFHLNNCLKK